MRRIEASWHLQHGQQSNEKGGTSTASAGDDSSLCPSVVVCANSSSAQKMIGERTRFAKGGTRGTLIAGRLRESFVLTQRYRFSQPSERPSATAHSGVVGAAPLARQL